MIIRLAIGSRFMLLVYKMMVRLLVDGEEMKLGMVFGKPEQRFMTKDGTQSSRSHIMSFDLRRKINTFGVLISCEILVGRMKGIFGC